VHLWRMPATDPRERTFGGFLPLERVSTGQWPVTEGVLLGSGRACLRFIVEQLKPKRMFVPFLVCDSVTLPLREAGVDVVFYGVDEQLKPLFIDALGANDLLLAVDHHGIRHAEVEALVRQHGDRVVIDLTHALYAPVVNGCWAFSSIRKWFGIPDGGLLHAPVAVDVPAERNTHYIMDHLVLRLLEGEGEASLTAHRRNNAMMRTNPTRASVVSEALLRHTDREQARAARLSNFRALHALLGAHNRLSIDPERITGAIAYPFLPHVPIAHEQLHARGLFVPCYWPDVLQRSDPEGRFEVDRMLARNILPLPIDQRYVVEDMREVVRRIMELLSSA
jgi:hypothetical protein